MFLNNHPSIVGMVISFKNWDRDIRKGLFIVILAILLISCQEDSKLKDKGKFCFTSSHSLELPFANQIEDDTLSVFNYHYLYNGGGVGIADFNRDGHKDIVLGGNLVSSTILLGDGDLSFENVGKEVNFVPDAWVNGISIVDINHDNLPDIYLSVGGPNCDNENCKNLLFINQFAAGKLSFAEVGEVYGLDIAAYGQQGLFIDLDLDGDLDLYQLQNYVDPLNKNYPKPKRYFSKMSYDKVLINQEVETGMIYFEDRSEEWGIKAPGFGLGIATSDFNNDGYPDLYIANDFITDDILYINNKGKNFVDQSKEILKHTTYNSMGVDIGYVNQDTLQDILVVDMLPFENERQKTMLGSMNYDKYKLSISQDYNHQYIRNTLQLHNGFNQNKVLPFSDVAPLYNVHATDWSWSPLIADFDNNGYNDIYISNGYGKNITDLDFVNYNSNLVGFGNRDKIEDQIKADVASLPDVKLPNHFYMNEGTTLNESTDFKASITNGVAYADLDNDGDLDLVQNNINDPANILINQSSNAYLKINLQGSKFNTKAIGAKVKLHTTHGKTLIKENTPVRSYLSCMDSEIVFGLGQDTVRRIEVFWPDHKVSNIDTTISNATIVISADKSVTLTSHQAIIEQGNGMDTLATKSSPLRDRHDFTYQPLLFKSCLRENVMVSKSKNEDLLYLANLDANIKTYDLSADKLNNRISLPGKIVSDFIEFDIDKDQEMELIVLSNDITKNDSPILQVFDSNLTLLHSLILEMGIYKCIEVGDELYVYGAAHATTYPSIKNGALRKVVFENQGISLGPIEMESASGLTGVDVVRGETSDYVATVGEWSSPEIYKVGDTFEKCSSPLLDSLSGMWQDVYSIDLDNDGDDDLVLSNLGENTRLSASYQHPIFIVNDDIDGNGSIDPIMSLYNASDNNDYTYASRDDIVKQVPGVKQKYTDYLSFSKQSFESIVSSFGSMPVTLKIHTLKSVILENTGGCQFRKIGLPQVAQSSIVNKVLSADMNQDGLQDLILLTNDDTVELHNGKIDALQSYVLLNKGKMKFVPASVSETGFSIFEAAIDGYVNEDNEIYIGSNKAFYKYKVNR